MSWDDLEKAAKEGGGGVFVKLKDGEEIVGVFAGEARFFYHNFQEKREYNAPGPGRNFRFRINILTKDDSGEYSAKVFEQGKRFCNMLLEMKNEYGLDYIYKIKRTGTTQDNTVYTIFPKGPVPSETLEKLKNVKLLPLESEPQAKQEHVDEDGLPF